MSYLWSFWELGGSTRETSSACGSTRLRTGAGAKPHDAEVVEHAQAVAVIVRPQPDQLLLVRQYRHPLGRDNWEVVAGGMNPGESPEDAAARELREETGYRAQRVERLWSAYTAPGFCEELLHFCVVDGYEIGEPQPDENEEIELGIFGLETLWREDPRRRAARRQDAGRGPVGAERAALVVALQGGLLRAVAEFGDDERFAPHKERVLATAAALDYVLMLASGSTGARIPADDAERAIRAGMVRGVDGLIAVAGSIARIGSPRATAFAREAATTLGTDRARRGAARRRADLRADRAGQRVIDAAALIASLDAGETELLDAEMRSALLHHGRRTARVVVLLHGLSASPRTWHDFAATRFARGENVLVPRLPRHGHQDRMTDALEGLHADELRLAGERILDAAAALGEEVVLVGHSLGGALALHLAHGDERVERVVAVAPFLGIARLPHDWNAVARRLLERAPNRFLYWNPLDKGRGLPAHGYTRYTTRALAAGLGLAEALRADARAGPPRARHVEIVRNAHETAVNNRAIDDLIERWRAVGGERVRVHRLVGLGYSHDVIEPERRHAPALRFLPHLHALLDAPPPDQDLTIDARA